MTAVAPLAAALPLPDDDPPVAEVGEVGVAVVGVVGAGVLVAVLVPRYGYAPSPGPSFSSPDTAFQSVLVTKLQPKVSNASRPPHAIDAAAPPSTIRTSHAAPAVTSLNSRSAPAPLLGAAGEGELT